MQVLFERFANRLKRALPKFRGDRSEVREVNGRSKFVAASAGRAERKQLRELAVSPKAEEKGMSGRSKRPPWSKDSHYMAVWRLLLCFGLYKHQTT